MQLNNKIQGMAYLAIAFGAGVCAMAVVLTFSESAHAQTAQTLVSGTAMAGEGSPAPVQSGRNQPVSLVPETAEANAHAGGEAGDDDDDAAADPWLGGKWQIGALGTVSTSIYRDGDDWELGGLPMVAYDAERLHVGVDGLRATVWQNDRFSVSAIGSVRFSPFDSGDGPYLAGMEDRDLAFEAGASFSAQVGPGEITASHLFDVSDAHNGQEVDISYSQPTQLSAVTLVWGGGVTWQSEKLTQYMVGVNRREARANRAYYNPDDAFIPHLDLTVSYPVYDGLALIGKTGVQFLPDVYTDSPIVDKDYLVSFALGVVYTF